MLLPSLFIHTLHLFYDENPVCLNFAEGTDAVKDQAGCKDSGSGRVRCFYLFPVKPLLRWPGSWPEHAAVQTGDNNIIQSVILKGKARIICLETASRPRDRDPRPRRPRDPYRKQEVPKACLKQRFEAKIWKTSQRILVTSVMSQLAFISPYKGMFELP